MEENGLSMDVTQWTALNKLYTLELAITKMGRMPERYNPVPYRIPFMIYANAKWSKDGQWGTTYFGSTILGVSSGYWSIVESKLSGPYTMVLYKEKPPSALTIMWNDMPEACGLIEEIPKFPIPLASSGNGSIDKAGDSAKNNWFTWRVAERRF
jgi:hypothetical protein